MRADVEEGVGEVVRRARRELDEVYAAYAEPDADFDKLAAEQAAPGGDHRRGDGGNLDHSWKSPPTRCACRRGTPTIGNLSGGEKRRVALCRLLLSKPDMLLLDEPTNHLDAESVEWLEQFLGAIPGTVVAITHDRYFLDNAAEWILELDRGRGIPWKGNYSSWLEQKDDAPEAGRSQRDGAPASAIKRGTGMGAPEPQGRARPRARRAWPASRN